MDKLHANKEHTEIDLTLKPTPLLDALRNHNSSKEDSEAQ